ncbi:ABC transporter substrate-binding protein [Aliagarivorans marinus]|uniref:ABC transporter substrate-binding protein n=1 Tax=Aliagarivorans marinus TaxID=561965 RepID=UPI0003FF78F9|nr:ABC transporter substrate-binding protein [Aliagarivorans marinus]
MRWIAALVLGLFAGIATSSPTSVKIYFDADRTSHLASALSIEQGVKVALQERGNTLSGVPVEFVELDHRGNAARSKKNMAQFASDPQALVLIGGLHSPPLIKYREYINQSKILTLVPWAAGGPITRYPSPDNYVFRLSVDDTKVGRKLVEFALDRGCNTPHLLLEQTPWGKSNHRNMLDALPDELKDVTEVTWFNWGLTDAKARLIASNALKQQAECVLMVANAVEGAEIVKAFSGLQQQLPIYSHWGITGGNFQNNVDFDTRERAQLHFIQSCFNFYSSQETELSKAVLAEAMLMFPDNITSKAIAAPAGFVHGYDLARLLIKAADQITLQDDSEINRMALKHALENINSPVQGLIKEYHAPFTQFTEANIDAHEALDASDLCMARYDQNNAIQLIE